MEVYSSWPWDESPSVVSPAIQSACQMRYIPVPALKREKADVVNSIDIVNYVRGQNNRTIAGSRAHPSDAHRLRVPLRIGIAAGTRKGASSA